MKTKSVPKIFRITIEVADLEKAAGFYQELLGAPGTRHPGASFRRHVRVRASGVATPPRKPDRVTRELDR